MSNGKDLRKAQKAIKAGKPVVNPYKYDIDYMSKMGYRDDSPYNQNPYNDIYTPNGMIDMSQTGIPLYANGQYLPPYSGMHDLGTSNVREVPANQFPIAQKGLGFKMERKVDDWLGYPQEFGQKAAAYKGNQIDNVRHAAAAYKTAKALSDKVSPYIGEGLGNIAGFIGSNVLGLGHELFGENNTGREHMEDLYNNLIGAKQIFAGMSPQATAEYIRQLSSKGKLAFGDKRYGGDPSLPNITGHYQGGGWLDAYQDGGKKKPYQAKSKTDYDYRKQMYNDSLALNNFSKFQIDNELNGKSLIDNIVDIGFNFMPRNIGNRDYSQKVFNYAKELEKNNPRIHIGLPNKNPGVTENTYKKEGSTDVYHDKIKPSSYWMGDAINAFYKKPVQEILPPTIDSIKTIKPTKSSIGKSKRTDVYTDKALFDKAFAAEKDSLNLNLATLMQDKLMGPKSFPEPKYKNKWSTKDLKKGREKRIIPGLENLGSLSEDFQNEYEQFHDNKGNKQYSISGRKEDEKLIKYYKSLGFTDKDIMYHSSPDIVSDKIKPIYTYYDGTASSPYYKEPVVHNIYKPADDKKNVYYTDKEMFNKAYKAEMDSSNAYKKHAQDIKGWTPLSSAMNEDKVKEFVKNGNNIRNAYFNKNDNAITYLDPAPKKPVIHNIYQESKPKEELKKQIPVFNSDTLTRHWNFNGPNPTLEYYDKTNKLVKAESYDNVGPNRKLIKQKHGGWLDTLQNGGLRAASTTGASAASTKAPQVLLNNTDNYKTGIQYIQEKWKNRDPSDNWNLLMPDKYGSYVDSGVDPFALMLAAPQGAIKTAKAAGKYLTEETPLKNAYKYNPRAFKPQKDKIYRQVGKPGFNDALIEGKVYDKGQKQFLENNPNINYLDEYNEAIKAKGLYLKKPSSAPFFSKDELFFPINRKATGKGFKKTANSDAEYLIEGSVPDEALLPRYMDKYLKPGEKTSTFVLRPEYNDLENFKIYKRDWLKGYKEIPNSSVKNAKTVNDKIADIKNKVAESRISTTNNINKLKSERPKNFTENPNKFLSGEWKNTNQNFVNQNPLDANAFNGIRETPIDPKYLDNFLLNNKPSEGFPLNKYGGQKKLKRTTSKNIQSSINDLMLRNETLFGPPGKVRYKPKLKYGQGGWLDQFDK